MGFGDSHHVLKVEQSPLFSAPVIHQLAAHSYQEKIQSHVLVEVLLEKSQAVHLMLTYLVSTFNGDIPGKSAKVHSLAMAFSDLYIFYGQ